jgi:hypothetical protein
VCLYLTVSLYIFFPDHSVCDCIWNYAQNKLYFNATEQIPASLLYKICVLHCFAFNVFGF